MNRRNFLKLLAVTGTGALSACAGVPVPGIPRDALLEGCYPNGPTPQGEHYDCGVVNVNVGNDKDEAVALAGQTDGSIIEAIKTCCKMLDHANVPTHGRYVRITDFEGYQIELDWGLWTDLRDHTGIPYGIGDDFEVNVALSGLAPYFMTERWRVLGMHRDILIAKRMG